MDDEQHEKYMKKMFYNEERTEHNGILPAKDRIKQYKTKSIKKQWPTGLPPRQQISGRMKGTQSQVDLKNDMADMKGGQRPVTAGIASTFGISENPTQASEGFTASQLAMNARAVSASRFSKFSENEKSVRKESFKAFFTSNEPTVYHKENRFEGRSNYMRYYPTGETFEQEMEKFWWDAKNKELADKRRDEEAQQTMAEWGNARGRMEAEIARKKEHLNVATNFKQARGWTRSNWKTKNHVPELNFDDFIQQSSSEEEDDVNPLAGDSPEVKKEFGSHAKTTKSQANYIDLTTDAESYGFRPSTAVLSAQLQAIDDHNQKLPPKKKKKESLPEISAPNVVCKTLQVRDFKKQTSEYIKKYRNVGIVDETTSL